MMPIGDDNTGRTLVPAGMGMLGGGSQAGGVAYAAHIGGFIAGLILVKAFAVGRRPR